MVVDYTRRATETDRRGQGKRRTLHGDRVTRVARRGVTMRDGRVQVSSDVGGSVVQKREKEAPPSMGQTRKAAYSSTAGGNGRR